MPPDQPSMISADDPNLQTARKRFRRTMLAWGIILGLVGLLSTLVLRERYPLAALPWLITAALLLIGSQPAFLALVAVQWGLSIVTLIPGIGGQLGPDPLSYILESGLFEAAVLVAVRIIMVVTAFNQFLFYRLLYGTERMTGLEEGFPPIPPVIENRTNLLAQIARGLGLLAVFTAFIAGVFLRDQISTFLLPVAVGIATYAIGFGVGSAFSPTDRRGAALTGVGLGSLGFLMAMIIARLV